jgi:DNA primase catalytic subunit
MTNQREEKQMQATKTVDRLTNREALVWDFTDQGVASEGSWERADNFVRTTFPDAVQSGVGYWKIPRTAEIFYGVGRVRYVPMKGKALPE